MFEEFQVNPYISSGHRCKHYNKLIGGSKGSMHVKAKAVDILVPKVPAVYVFTFMDKSYPDTLGLGLYNTHTHIDTRRDRARWDVTT